MGYYVPNEAEIRRAFDEGKRAAQDGLTFKNHCPYTFEKSGMTPQEFHAFKRPMMESWFKGWKGA